MLAIEPYINLQIISKTYDDDISNLLILIPGKVFTAPNKIIETASFTIPSPKIIENSFGYLSGLIIANAQTVSVAQSVAEYISISYNVIFNWSLPSVKKPLKSYHI